MKTFLLFCLLPFVSLNAAEIAFKEATTQEASAIELHLISFYAKQLLKAGHAENLDQAIEVAKMDWKLDQETGDKFYYVHLVSKEDATPLGYLIYCIDQQLGYIEAIYIKKAYRGQGIGKQALQILENIFRKKEIESIRLHVFAH